MFFSKNHVTTAYRSAQRFFIKSYNVFVYGPEFVRLTVIGDQICKTCTRDLPEERRANLMKSIHISRNKLSTSVIVAKYQINF